MGLNDRKQNLDDVKLKKFIQNFNKDFNCNIPDDTKTFLINLYENFILLSSSSKVEGKYLTQIVELEDKINKKLNSEEFNLFNEFDRIKDKMWQETNEESFVYGYCVCELLHKISSSINQN